MASLPYLIPTARYKRAVKVGSKVTFQPEEFVVDNGRITDLFWSTDQSGTNRVDNIDELSIFYLQVRTQDIYTTVSISIESTIDNDEVIEGTIDQIYAIPITTNPQTGVGSGFARYTIDEDEDVFKNSSYVNVTSQRTFGTPYTNNTGKSIMVNLTVDDTYNHSPTIQVIVNGVTIISDNYDNSGNRSTGSWSFIVPPGQVYQVNALSFAPTIWAWAELRPNGT